MSRHKIVKNLDLDDELDDYDGGDGYMEDEAEGIYDEPSFTSIPAQLMPM